jgi:U3 small nucleolar RNA-associated protein 23
MRAKRAKQYKKLMQQFAHLGFREPYQVLVDAELVKDVARFKMDLQAALDRTLRGKAKPSMARNSLVRGLRLISGSDNPVLNTASL